MNLPTKIILATIVAGLLGGSAGAAYYVKKGGLEGDIASRAARLQKVQSDLDYHLTDLSRLQQSFAALPPAGLPSEESRILQARISNEQVVIQSELLQIVEDAGFLRGHWSALTPQQKNFLASVEKNRT